MSLKEKLLGALNAASFNVTMLKRFSEEQLVDILITAHRINAEELDELQAQRDREHEGYVHERDAMRREVDRSRTDPLYLSTGQYFFSNGKQKFHLLVADGQLKLMERVACHDFLLQPLSFDQWHQIK